MCIYIIYICCELWKFHRTCSWSCAICIGFSHPNPFKRLCACEHHCHATVPESQLPRMTCWVTRFCCNPRKGLQNSLSLLKVGRNIYIPIIDSPRFLGVTTGQLPMHRFGPSNLWQVDGCYQLLSGATA